MKRQLKFLANLALCAVLLLPTMLVQSFAAFPVQGQPAPFGSVAIDAIGVFINGKNRTLRVAFKTVAKNGAVFLGADVTANMKFTNGAVQVKSKSVGPNVTVAEFDANAPLNAKAISQPVAKAESKKEVAKKVEQVAEAKGKKASDKAQSLPDKKFQRTPRAASLPGEDDGGGKPLPGGGGGGGFAIVETATVTVTARFSGGQEAVNIVREFVPPALNPTGELKARSGAGSGEVQIAKVIELAKSPRAAQCQAGRDCFEIVTQARDFSGNNGKGFNVNLEVIYSDGSRKTASAALTSPGRPVVLSVDRPAGASFTSVLVKVRGQGDGVFTKSDTKTELLSF